MPALRLWPAALALLAAAGGHPGPEAAAAGGAGGGGSSGDCAAAAAGAEDAEESCALHLGAWRRGPGLQGSPKAAAPAHAGRCLQYSAAFPARSGTGQLVANLTVRYAEVDLKTLSVPFVFGEKAGKLAFEVQYNGYATPREGNQGFGFDQYTIHYQARRARNASFWGQGDLQYTVSGLYPNAAFLSVVASYGPGEEITRQAQELTATFLDSAPAPNPFRRGNPTVLSYKVQASCARAASLLPRVWHPRGRVDEEAPPSARPRASSSKWRRRGSCRATNTEVFRAPADLVPPDEPGAVFGINCSRTYLFSPGKSVPLAFPTVAPKSVYNFTYGFIRLKVPRVFNNRRDLLFRGLKSAANPGGYDLLMFSVSTNYLVPPAPGVPFTVSASMLQGRRFQTRGGIAYVLFAPTEEVQRMVQPGDTAPPVVYLPRFKIWAYVLSEADFLFVFRYRNSDPNWPGSPAFAPCAPNATEALKSLATCDDLGDYLPQITRVQAGSVESLASKVSP